MLCLRPVARYLILTAPYNAWKYKWVAANHQKNYWLIADVLEWSWHSLLHAAEAMVSCSSIRILYPQDKYTIRCDLKSTESWDNVTLCSIKTPCTCYSHVVAMKSINKSIKHHSIHKFSVTHLHWWPYVTTMRGL